MAQTLVVNPTVYDRFYGYLPPHGVLIPAGGDVTLDGDLRTVLAGGRGRYSRRTELNSLRNDEFHGLVQVTPLPDSEPSSSTGP